MKPITAVVIVLLAAVPMGAMALANTARDAILANFAKQAGSSLSASRGEAFFKANHAGGKSDTPSCTTCHTTNPTNPGRTRAGKAIEPMAVSANPQRFTDPAKVEKWLRRNCETVLGRECTPAEKGDVITWLSSQ